MSFSNRGQSLIGIIIILVVAGLITGGLFFYLQKQIPEVPEITERPVEEEAVKPEKEAVISLPVKDVLPKKEIIPKTINNSRTFVKQKYAYKKYAHKNIITIESPDSLLVWVNKNRRLPANYMPKDLVLVTEYEIPSRNPDALLRKIAVNSLKEMIDSATKQGINLKVISAYRSYDAQKRVYNHWVKELGRIKADRVSARPGHSEHQLGLAVDFNELNIAFGKTPAGLWLKKNAWRYGWLISHPLGAERITGFTYEPWHYRYIGKANAFEMQKSGIILAEFLEIKNKQ